MAFSFKEQSNNSWINILVYTLVVAAIAGGVYMLFFAEAPFIEVVAPPDLETVSDLSKVNFSAGDFQDDPVFRSLRRNVSEAEPGPAGRDNPFAPF